MLEEPYHEFEKIKNKKILIFDLETTGLPEIIKEKKYTDEEYYDPIDFKKYNSSRIVEIAYVFINDFDFKTIKDLKINIDVIKKYIRKPIDFNEIPEESIKYHKITYEIAKSKGIVLEKILDDELSDALEQCDYIIGHNIIFDINVLLSELYRLPKDKKHKNIINDYNNLKNIKENKMYLCTARMGQNILKKTYMPKLENLYNKLCNKKSIDFHHATDDVYAVLLILQKFIDKYDELHKYNNKKVNVGKKWDDVEKNKLIKELEKKMSIEEISKIHGRNEGGIMSERKRLIVYDIIKGINKDDLCKKYNLSKSEIKNYYKNDNDSLDYCVDDISESKKLTLQKICYKIENIEKKLDILMNNLKIK